MFYAAYHSYDVRFTNDVYVLRRFDTRKERDEFVYDERPDRQCNYHWESVTWKQAKAYCPEAFKSTMCHACPDERDWHDDEYDAYMYEWEYDERYRGLAAEEFEGMRGREVACSTPRTAGR